MILLLGVAISHETVSADQRGYQFIALGGVLFLISLFVLNSQRPILRVTVQLAASFALCVRKVIVFSRLFLCLNSEFIAIIVRRHIQSDYRG